MAETLPVHQQCGDHHPPRTAQAEISQQISAGLAYLIDRLPDAILFLDREWRLTYANAQAMHISRLTPADLNGRTHWELFPDTVGTKLEHKYRRTMEERTEEEIEFYYERYGMWLHLRSVPIDTGIAIHYRDVTSGKEIERLRDSTAHQLQQVFDATTDGIVSLDREWNFTFLNRRARELLAPSGEVFGTNIWQSFPGTVYEGSPYMEHYHKAMEQGVPGEFEAYYPAPLNLWLQVQVRPAEDGIIIFFRDITQQRQSEEALHQRQLETERQRAELATVYDTAPIGLALFDPVEFRYLRLNARQAEIVGMPIEDVLGYRVTDLAPIPGLHEMFEQVAAGEPVRNQLLEGELKMDPGSHRYWTVNYFPVYSPDGSIQAISAASLEITQQKKAENALLQSEKLAAVGRLASSISHEINNPLEAVTNLLYLIGSDKELPSALSAWVETAQLELSRVSQIATQTLRFHRQSDRPTWVSPAQLVDVVLNLYLGRLTNSGIQLEVAFRTEARILCFENDIRQVLNNLIANAMDAMRNGGRLVVRAHDATDHPTGRRGIRINVADTGHGMSPEVRARVYEPFYTTKELNGTGLGLWISADIVERHQGRLRLRSRAGAVGHGTVFSLFLPREER
jgi:PAS domain S-box-containing protein